MPDPSEPKIIIDSDWKAQAQKEKERLAAQEREAAEKAPRTGPEGGAGGAGSPYGDLPPADFNTLVGTLVSQALLYLGGFPDPQTGRALVSLEHARFHIDLLAVLQDKTKGNVTKDEETELAHALNELRLRYVEISRAIAQMQAKAAAEQGGAGAAGGVGGEGGEPFTPNLRLRQD